MPSPTLFRPPPTNPSQSPIENVLRLTPLTDIGPDIFTNTRELWHPRHARGVYGGAVIAQCLCAAQRTIPLPSLQPSSDTEFLIHSMHCYFVLAGDASIPILYHVERVRDGKSFITRTVQARQKGKVIFTTTCSFMREGSAGKKVVEHEWGLPQEARATAGSNSQAERGAKDEEGGQEDGDGEDEEDEGNGLQSHGPFVSRRLGVANNDSPHPHTKRPQQWIRARGRISPSAGPQAHLSALAYMSDSWFIGTVSRVHNLWPFGKPPPTPTTTNHAPTAAELRTNASHINRPAAAENDEKHQEKRQIGMMVSLDHTIYFHRPREVVADEWMFSEMESPWAGEGRGLVLQRIWDKEGRLLASCVQEGLCRLVQDERPRGSKL